jgi:hypothetical protein
MLFLLLYFIGSNARLIDVPYEVHSTFNYYNLCVQNIITQILYSWGQGPLDTSCLDTLVPPDFDGSDAATQSLSVTAFGVADLWNSGGQRDQPAAVCPNCPTCQACSNGSDSKDVNNVEIATLALTSLFTVLLLVLVLYFVLSGSKVPAMSTTEMKSNNL